MKKSMLVLGVAALTLASCSQEEMIVNSKVDDGSIAFRARIPMATRADITTSNLEEFSVSAFYSDGTRFFGKEIFSKETDGDGAATGFFTSSNTYFWPTDGSNVTFIASAPREGNPNYGLMPHVANVSADKFYIKDFEAEVDIDRQRDLVTAAATGNKADNSKNGVALTFSHALSKVSVVAHSDDANYSYSVAGVKLGMIPKLSSYTFAPKDGAWTHEWEILALRDQPTLYGDFTWTYDAPVALGSAVDDAMLAKSFMPIPQALTPWDNKNNAANVYENGSKSYGAYLAVLVRIVNKKNGKVEYPYSDGSVDAITETIDGEEYAWVAFPIDTYWESGTCYKYDVDFTNGAGYVAPFPAGSADEKAVQGTPVFGGPIKMVLVEVSDWDSTDDQTIFGNTNIDTTEEDDPFGDEGGEDDPF